MKRKTLVSVFVILSILLATCISTFALPASSGTRYDGIDVSRYQGSINFQRVADAGIEVVYIRASSGTGTDSRFSENARNAKAAGLKIGFYHYVTARSVSGARQQADYFANLIADIDYDCLPCIDFESFGSLSTSEINQVATAFIERLAERTGHNVLIYSNASDATSVFSESLTKYPLWVAHWGVDTPSSNVRWDSWAGWQYTSEGRVSGISGNVDRDYFTDDVLLSESNGSGGSGSGSNNTGNESGSGTIDGDITYTIRSGDTLSALANRYGSSISSIAALNGIDDPNLIYVGETLTIRPTVAGADTAAYVVVTGDTLWGIANANGTTVDELAELNNIWNPDLICPGEVFLLPAGA